MARYGMVIDLSRCMGCRSCVEACKIENNTGEGMFWMYVFRTETGTYPNVRWSFTPRPCQHCDNAPCVKVCPVGARFKREDGLVLTDFDRCIGCRYCEVACPYGVNYFNWKKPSANQYYDWDGKEGVGMYGAGDIQDEIGDVIPPYQNPDHEKKYGPDQRLVSGGNHYKGTVGKCTFCVQRTDKGMLPACVATCPVQTLNFGDLDDPNSNVSKLLAQKQSFRLLENLGTNPRVYYLEGSEPLHESHERLPEASEVRR